MVKQTSDSDITINEIMTELVALSSVPMQEEYEITVRNLIDQTDIAYDKARYLIDKLFRQKVLDRRKVRCENGNIVYAYFPSGEDKLEGWKKILEELK